MQPRRILIALLTTTAFIGIAPRVAGQTQGIYWRLEGDANSTYLSGTTISVGTISSTKRLWIFSYPSAASSISSSIQISGTVSDGAELRVMIAPDLSTWPTDPSTTLTNSAGNLAGLTFSDNDLRNASRLAAYLSGGVTGTVNIGQVFRLRQAGMESGGSVNAYASDNGTTGSAIRIVDCHGNVSLLGSIAAHTGSIDQIGVEPIRKPRNR